jgi:hypothetical protein
MRAKLEAERRIVELTSSYEARLLEAITDCTQLRQELAEREEAAPAVATSSFCQTPLHELSSHTALSAHLESPPSVHSPSSPKVSPPSLTGESGSHLASVYAEKKLSRLSTSIRVSSASPLDSPPPAQSTPLSGRAVAHKFVLATLPTVSACQFCTSVMRGLVRQGNVCVNCQYTCHAYCAPSLTDGHELCPTPTPRPPTHCDSAKVCFC